jgi:hypothetical protein
MRSTSIIVAVGAVLLVACDHSWFWSADRPGPLGPLSDSVPRRLTFNTGDDRAPSPPNATGVFAFSRYDAVASPTNCIAYLPAAGGTLVGTYCPPLPGTAGDTFVSTWREPVLSPDGAQVAFLWERSARYSVLAAWTHEIVVAPAHAPRAPARRVEILLTLPAGRVNTMLDPAWTPAGTVRFLAAHDSIWKVKGGGAARFTDTLVVPVAVVEFDPVTAAFAVVPGGDTALAWSPAASGGLWVVRPDGRLDEVTASGVVITRASSLAGARDIAEVAGRIVWARGNAWVDWLDPVSGARGQLPASGPVLRVAPAGGRRFIAEVERGVDQFGMPASFWLMEVP